MCSNLAEHNTIDLGYNTLDINIFITKAVNVRNVDARISDRSHVCPRMLISAGSEKNVSITAKYKNMIALLPQKNVRILGDQIGKGKASVNIPIHIKKPRFICIKIFNREEPYLFNLIQLQ